MNPLVDATIHRLLLLMEEHWTAESAEAFEYAIASDFIGQLQTVLDACGVRQQDIATRLGVSAGYVSQVFNRPGNLTLKTLVALARTLGLKVSVVAYEDANELGPVNAEIFRACWEALGSPHDFFDLKESIHCT